MNTFWMILLTIAGMLLSLRVFGGIITGKFDLLFIHCDRDKGENTFAWWMTAGVAVCLVLFFIALRLYLGPLSF